MKLVIQRVSSASVEVEKRTIASMEDGLLVYAGIHSDDGQEVIQWMARKLATLRIFPDDEGKMNRSILDTGGAICIVSQFTLYGNAMKGTRPSFVEAARPEHAEPLYEKLIQAVKRRGIEVCSGQFGAMMNVKSVNDGPVTILLEKGIE